MVNGYWLTVIGYWLTVIASGAQTITEQYHELLAASKGIYQQAIGKDTLMIPLTGDQLSSNASDYQEGNNIEYMVDGDATTYWHSDWHNQVSDTHYIQVNFSQPISGNIGLYVLRRQTDGNHVTLMGVQGSNDQSHWDDIGIISLGNPIPYPLATAPTSRFASPFWPTPLATPSATLPNSAPST